MILNILIAIFLFSGALFFLVAAIGIVRLPDLYTRMHAAAKASAFGAVLMLAGTALHFRDLWTILEVVVIVVFLFITTPVATHLIGRAGYRMKVPIWKETRVDELRDALEGSAHDSLLCDEHDDAHSRPPSQSPHRD
jgi:multicomponent Na+:H+ antiporter subunit G